MIFLWLLLGGLLGGLIFLSQWWTVNAVDPAQAGAAKTWLFGGLILRLVMIIGFLAVALQQGFSALLAALAGLWLARWIMLVWIGLK